jgi:multicomponent Na+:H+ antiporter subunit G
MEEVLSAILMIVGAVFMLLAGLGLIRMPDLFLRMSATTKAATLGATSMLLAIAVYFHDLGITSRAVATIVFLLLTAPVAAHMIGRAAYFGNVPLWENTVVDDLSGRYHPATHALDSHPCNSSEAVAQTRANTTEHEKPGTGQ